MVCWKSRQKPIVVSDGSETFAKNSGMDNGNPTLRERSMELGRGKPTAVIPIPLASEGNASKHGCMF